MKIIVTAFLASLLITGCSAPTGKKQNELAMKDSQMNKTDTDGPAFSCKLTSPELQKRKSTAIAALKKQMKNRTELTNGYSYLFDGTEKMIGIIAEFIQSERSCCSFFNFTMAVTNDNRISLDITGADGVKDFIRTELEM